jgi:hypothetical protein
MNLYVLVASLSGLAVVLLAVAKGFGSTNR